MKIQKIIKIAKEKEDVRIKLVETAKRLAITAKENEDIRRKLAVTAKKLAVTAKEKEDTRIKLASVAKRLAVTAKEKEDVRIKLVETAKILHRNAKQKNKVSSKLKESEIRYRRLFETAHDGILMLDPENGQITDVNPFLEKLLGYTKSEFLQKKLWEVGAFRIRNIKAAKDVFKLLQKEGYVRYEDLPLETKDGKLISVEFVSNSYLAGGHLVIQCNIRDITERKKTELIKESKRLLKEEKSKVASIADATHELRTPLAIMKGNVDLAMNHNGKSPKSALRAINYEINHLSGILADLSLITSKAWELKNRIVHDKVNLKSLVNTVVGRCKAIAYKKKISISSKKIPNVTILGDKVYLEKMLVNLIKNSIIYGHTKGHTIISAKQKKGLITISITDNGIGISKEDLPHVFERFYSADKYHTSGGNSIGLGLAIVKWIAEVHGGEVSVRSSKKNGSVFSVNLPIKTVRNK
jgi:PAS domain S-box-containing protein